LTQNAASLQLARGANTKKRRFASSRDCSPSRNDQACTPAPHGDPTHIVAEVIDNAADEALAGFAEHIAVRLDSDGSVTVADDGRGIPVGPHPEEKVPTIELNCRNSSLISRRLPR
jgi:hypothetical protein